MENQYDPDKKTHTFNIWMQATFRVCNDSKTTNTLVCIGDALWHILEVHTEYLKECTKSITCCHFQQKREHKKMEKLVSNFLDKKNICINIKYLNQALKHGLKLKKKVHRVIAFEQCYSMKSYIMFNNKVKRMSLSRILLSL